MAGKPQNLTEGQKKEVISIIHKKLITFILIFLAILTGMTGYSLYKIYCKVVEKMEYFITKQFEEPRIQEVVENIASERASVLMTEQIRPEVTKFKEEISEKLEELYEIVKKTQSLEEQSRKHEESIQGVLISLERTLKENQESARQLSKLKSDIVEMQKLVASMQYYQMLGRNQFPNPYQEQMLADLNKLIYIAIPNPGEREKFIKELNQMRETNEK